MQLHINSTQMSNAREQQALWRSYAVDGSCHCCFTRVSVQIVAK